MVSIPRSGSSARSNTASGQPAGWQTTFIMSYMP
jgi:hypothetical protein